MLGGRPFRRVFMNVLSIDEKKPLQNMSSRASSLKMIRLGH